MSAEDVLSGAAIPGIKRVSSVRLGSFTQRAGLKLAQGVGSVAAAITILLIARTLWNLPHAPELNGSMTPETLQSLVAAQKENTERVISAGTRLFDSIIVKAFLPVFTSILGYIFGARSTVEGEYGE